MSTHTTGGAELLALHAALGPIAADTERILRPTADGPQATERCAGKPPRIYTWRDGAVVELHAHADEALPGSALLRDRSRLTQAVAATIGVPMRTDLVAWRPGRRAVLRIATATGTWWLKLLDAKSWRRAERAFAALGEPMAPIQFARPVSQLPGSCGYLTPSAEGVSLRDLIAAGAMSMTTVVRALLSLDYTRLAGDLPPHDFAAGRAAAVKSLQAGAGLHPELAELAQRIGDMTPPASPSSTGFVHGDLHDKQIFFADGRATLIDLEGAACGDGRFDIVNLAEHLRLRELQSGSDDLGTADQLLTRCAMHPDARDTVIWRAAVRARLAGVYALRPRWQPLVERLRTETLMLLERL